MTSVRYKTTRLLLGSLDTGGEYKPHFLDYQAYLSWRPSQRWSFDLLGNISDNHYNFEPSDRETKFGTMDNPRTFKVYFDGKENDFFRTFFGAATLTRHFTPNTYAALQLSTYSTKEHETYDIHGEYWLNESVSESSLGVGTYMEHARNRLQARVMNVGSLSEARSRPTRFRPGSISSQNGFVRTHANGKCATPWVILSRPRPTCYDSSSPSARKLT